MRITCSVLIVIKKSNFEIFKTRQNRQNLDRVKEVVFLGVIIDENLSGSTQVQNDARKVLKSIGIIYKSSFCLNQSSLLTLYYFTVQAYGDQPTFLTLNASQLLRNL